LSTGLCEMRATDVFIHSSPHSGSTWLGYVLGSSQSSAFVGELYRAWDFGERVPCTVCASRGLPECIVLGGIENVEPERAFELISSRNGRPVIVENSKKLDWTCRFLNRSDRETKLVHVIKDPRSRWASLRRRVAADLEKCMADWCSENQQIIDFSIETGVSTKVVSYDIIAANPEVEFDELFRFLGIDFVDSALRYWEVEHHGYAANGASSALIKHQNFKSPPKHFSTGDDQFYAKNYGCSFVDDRWRAELPDEETEAILANKDVLELLDGLGYVLTKSAIYRGGQSKEKVIGRKRIAWPHWLRMLRAQR
jgi:hypothetical protein